MSSTTALFADAGFTNAVSATALPRSVTPTVRLRITRRGRLALFALIALPITAAIGATVGSPATATGADASVQFSTVTVRAGESLWLLAERVAPDADPRDVVTDIASLNNLTEAELLPGQTLALPERYKH